MTWRALSARPHHLAAEVRKFEKQRVENKSTYWLIFELTWRDFYKFFAIKHGDNIFGSEGTTAARGGGGKWVGLIDYHCRDVLLIVHPCLFGYETIYDDSGQGQSFVPPYI